MYNGERLSFIIPCFRSEKTIQIVVAEIFETFKNAKNNIEIILVDDNSPDGVWKVIKKIANDDPCVKGIRLSKNMGQHSALMAGYRNATGNIIISLDDDRQSPVDELPKLIAKLDDGFDVVFGSYPEKKENAFRRFGTRVNDIMACVMINKPRNLALNSVFVMRRFVMEEILQYNNPYPYIAGLILRSTAHMCNVQVNHRDRQEGKSGYNLRKLLSLWMNGFTSFSVKPLRFATIVGLFCAFLGFVYGIWVLIRKLGHPEILAGYSSTVALLLFIGGMIMLMLGLVGEYIGRIYISINNSPQYVIRETINVEKNDADTRKDY